MDKPVVRVVRGSAAGIGLTLLVGLGQAGCGGGSAAGAQGAAPVQAPRGAAAAAAPVVVAAAPAGDPSAQPADYGARTRPGLYLRRADAERIDRERGGAVVWVDLACCNANEPDLPVLIAYTVQATKNLAGDAPFFVTGSDLRGAAQVVNHLARNGAPNVYLVTP